MVTKCLALMMVGLVAQSAWADDDAGLSLKMANPGDTETALIRELPPESAADEQLPIDVTAEAAVPETDEWQLIPSLKASLRLSVGSVSPFPLDAESTRVSAAPLESRFRVSPEIHLARWGVVVEADAATGAIVGLPAASVVGERQPVPSLRAVELRKAYLEYAWSTGVFRVGQQTSHWGLGLLANDGARDPEAGDFGQQHFGNLTYRALLVTRPWYGWGRAWRGVELAAAADMIVRDNFGEFARGDRAFQGVLALRFHRDDAHQVGLYAVYRRQHHALVTDGGKSTEALVIDLAGQWDLYKRRFRQFSVGFEIAGITGTSTQARNENASVLRVAQLGGAIKAKLRWGRATLLFDGGYASGDQNPSDDRLENFRFDRDYKVGLILFDSVLAYQTARAAVRAGDPSLAGVAAEGVELLPTQGAVTGAWYLFPRVKVSMADWLDGYGGPLFAFSSARMVDPFRSRIQGGAPVNVFGVSPGSYLGTEFDVGAQARWALGKALQLVVTAEGGLFLAGDAFNMPDGDQMAPVGFGRLRVGVSL